jgi:hypothetical protein
VALLSERPFMQANLLPVPQVYVFLFYFLKKNLKGQIIVSRGLSPHGHPPPGHDLDFNDNGDVVLHLYSVGAKGYGGYLSKDAWKQARFTIL